jgi:hypothetical protein
MFGTGSRVFEFQFCNIFLRPDVESALWPVGAGGRAGAGPTGQRTQLGAGCYF